MIANNYEFLPGGREKANQGASRVCFECVVRTPHPQDRGESPSAEDSEQIRSVRGLHRGPCLRRGGQLEIHSEVPIEIAFYMREDPARHFFMRLPVRATLKVTLYNVQPNIFRYEDFRHTDFVRGLAWGAGDALWSCGWDMQVLRHQVA